MTELAARKHLILAQAELHRRLLALERAQLQSQCESARAFIDRNRWWLLGGAAVGGWLLLRDKPGRLLGWLPAIISAARALPR